MPDDLVVEAIDTLQSFFGRPNCVYIVAADEKQLKRAVRRRSQGPAREMLNSLLIPTDETFLEKIFQVSVHVPPLYGENLSNYAQAVATNTLLGAFDPGVRDEVLSYLVHPDVSSPRQVKVIISDFLLTLEQARQRERLESTYLAHEPLSEDLLLIAKLVVIRAHFSWFFELLQFDPELLAAWPDLYESNREAADERAQRITDLVRDAARGAAIEAQAFAAQEPAPTDSSRPYVGRVTEKSLLDGLYSYLRRTSATVPVDPGRVQEFIFLRSREVFAGLTGTAGRLYRRAIANADLRLLSDAIQTDRTQLLAAAHVALAAAHSGFGVEREIARTPLAAIVAELPEIDLPEIAAEAAAVLLP